VDLQPTFLRAVQNGEAIQRRCSLAIQAAVGLGIPIFFTEQVPEKLGSTEPVLLSLAPAAKTFGKSTFSAWNVAAFAERLVTDQIEHVLVCGLETPVCIYQTTLDLLGADIQVTLLADCLAARRLDDATVCLAALGRAGAHILPCETVFYALLRDAVHPFFKTYTELVKREAAPR
jgi:nicotinamidase-related amidase